MTAWFLQGGVTMWPLLALLVVVAVQTAKATRLVARRPALPEETGPRDPGRPPDLLRVQTSILVWGTVALLLGVLGTVTGAIIMATAISGAGSVTAGLVWQGLGVSLVSVDFGLRIFVVSLLAWLGIHMARHAQRRRARRTFLPTTGLLLIVASAGCDDATPPGVTVGDSAGVRIVAIAPDAPVPVVSPTLLTELTPPDGVLNPMPWGVAGDPVNRRIYVADRLGDRVIVFDGTGAFRGVVGRPGDGPGEFRNPSAAHVGGDGTLHIWDVGRGVISRWSPEGALLSEERPEVQYWGPGFVVGDEGLMTVTNEPVEGEMGMDQRLVLYRDGASHLLHRLHLPMELMELPCMTRPAPTVFAPSLIWTGSGRRTYVHRGPGYRIDVLEDTLLVASIRRGIDPMPVTEAMAAEAVEFGPTPYRPLLRMCDVTPLQVVRAVGHEEVASPILAFASGPDGGLWVTRTDDGITPSAVDVFAPDGHLRFTLQVPAAVVAVPSPSTFVAMEVDRATEQVRLFLFSHGGDVSARTPAESIRSGGAGPTTSTGARMEAAPWVPPPPDAKLVPGDEFRDCPECPLLVVVPPGRFTMGSPEGEGRTELAPHWHHLLLDEYPRVEIDLDAPMAVGKFEVTFAEWDRCRDAGGCTRKLDHEGHGRGDRPVINTGRPDAEEYLAWLSRETGETYRLPSEAEWEYAARAGTASARHWGEEIGDGRAACTGCGGRWNGRSTAPVGSFQPNAFGLHDMLGNASEWVSDCYVRENDARPLDGRPALEASPYWNEGGCTVFVSRGGGWRSETYKLRSGARHPYNTAGPWGLRGSSTSGFRVWREVGTPASVGGTPHR